MPYNLLIVIRYPKSVFSTQNYRPSYPVLLRLIFIFYNNLDYRHCFYELRTKNLFTHLSTDLFPLDSCTNNFHSFHSSKVVVDLPYRVLQSQERGVEAEEVDSGGGFGGFIDLRTIHL